MVFSSRYPDLALHLHFSSPQKKSVVEDDHIVPAWDRIDILYVYGLGLGSHAISAMQWLAENRARQLIFLEDDLAVLHNFSQLPQAKEIIDHPQIHLRWVPFPRDWDAILEECAAQFSSDKIEVTASKTYKKLPRFRKIKLSLLRKSVLWHAVTSENISAHLLHKNILPNLRRIPACSYVNTWKDAWKGVPVIICGAGPSLQTVARDLCQLQDRALIIACGSALSALSHLGIRPHLGVAIDPNDREYDCLRGCAYRDLPLLFGSRLCPRVFELFDGPFGYIRSGTGSRLESYIEEELNMRDPFLGVDLGREALSVTTLALSLVQNWGCNPLIFAGVDLAYTRKKHYSDGVLASPQGSEQMIHRKGLQGRRVSTLIKWIMERDTIDHYAKNHPETIFLNGSPEGLGFKHIPHLPFQKIAETYLQKSVPLNVTQLMTSTMSAASSARVEEVFTSVRESLERCLELFKHLQQEEHTSGKAILYQTDLESELAYQLVFSSAEQALERVAQRSDPASLEREKWKFLEEAARSYLESI